MFRILVATTALFLAAPALACGGGNCDKHADCNKKTEAVDQTAKDDVDAADGTKIAFVVEGMHCGSCSEKITKALKALKGVNAAVVSHEAGEAKVAYDEAKTDADKLVAAITDLGFKATKQES